MDPVEPRAFGAHSKLEHKRLVITAVPYLTYYSVFKAVPHAILVAVAEGLEFLSFVPDLKNR